MIKLRGLSKNIWIGVNGGGDNSMLDEQSQNHGRPTTPHIIVSPDEEDTNFEFADNGELQDESPTSEEGGYQLRQSDAYEINNDQEPDTNGDPPPESWNNGQQPKVATINIESGNIRPRSYSGGELLGNKDRTNVEHAEHNRHNNTNSMYANNIRTENNLPMDFLELNSELIPRKSRRNSMIDLIRQKTASQTNLTLPLIPNFGMRRTSSARSIPQTPFDWRSEARESMILCISALYGKLLVVFGMAFPIAEIISDDVPLIFYNSFYLYLYFGSIFFLCYAYLFLLKADLLQIKMDNFKKFFTDLNLPGIPWPEFIKERMNRNQYSKSAGDDRFSSTPGNHRPPKYTIMESSPGSMYLKMGAVLFGIGSMVYSGLEFGQYFELKEISECSNVLMAITPPARMIFTFLQMYFIFLNSRVAISKHTTIARFGLMHMCGTNLCIWLNVLVQETKHEIAHLMDEGHGHHGGHGHSDDHHNESDIIGDDIDDMLDGGAAAAAVLGLQDEHLSPTTDSSLLDVVGLEKSNLTQLLDNLIDTSGGTSHNIIKRAVHGNDYCRNVNLMGDVVNSASPFLFPCTIEYSLLCAGVIYVMWKNINSHKLEKGGNDADSDISNFIAKKVRHHYSVDCARASRGLFMGIFVLVLTIISLILFYVLIGNKDFKEAAILEANVIEMSIYSVSLVSVIVGMRQMRELEFIQEGDIELDNILLIIAQAGVYIYNSFTIIGGYFNLEDGNYLPLMVALMSLAQATLQSLFILDASRRCCYTVEQLDRKPGREVVTFLIVCNLAMWSISTFETSRSDVHPRQQRFYGPWAWPIISHFSMPLAIFYRFHVSVCLAEIWKRSYKMKHDYMGL